MRSLLIIWILAVLPCGAAAQFSEAPAWELKLSVGTRWGQRFSLANGSRSFGYGGMALPELSLQRRLPQGLLFSAGIWTGRRQYLFITPLEEQRIALRSGLHLRLARGPRGQLYAGAYLQNSLLHLDGQIGGQRFVSFRAEHSLGGSLTYARSFGRHFFADAELFMPLPWVLSGSPILLSEAMPLLAVGTSETYRQQDAFFLRFGLGWRLSTGRPRP
jgi:hypothetical protein